MKHTPGNWTWHTSNSWRRLCSDQGRGKHVPVLTPTINPRDGHAELDVSKEDMALIAATPELYTACKAYLAAINGEDHGRAIDEAARASELIAAAVEKAEGRI
jgi:hypothetical protein